MPSKQILVRLATDSDLDFLHSIDHHLSLEGLKQKIASEEILICQYESNLAGCLRWGYFWDEIPFLNLIYIKEEYRSIGLGQLGMEYWHNLMKTKNYQFVLTSTLSNEPAQNFYRKLGYIDTGVLLLPEETAEIIFRKNI